MAYRSNTYQPKQDDYFDPDDDPDDHQEAELRHLSLDPRPSPPVSFILTTGTHHPGTSDVTARLAKDFSLYHLDIPTYLSSLRDTSAHPRAAYGHIHPSVYAERFGDRLGDADLTRSRVFAFFLVAILRWKIGFEVERGWEGFVVAGLEGWLRVCRAFVREIAEPVAVIGFKAGRPGALGQRVVIEQLFLPGQLFRVQVSASVEEMYASLLAETIGKHGLPSSASYSPLPSP